LIFGKDSILKKVVENFVKVFNRLLSSIPYDDFSAGAYEGESPAKKAEEALKQIIDKNYSRPYPDAVCVGMAIDDTVRQITEVKTVR
jgi:hypothetical protein